MYSQNNRGEKRREREGKPLRKPRERKRREKEKMESEREIYIHFTPAARTCPEQQTQRY